MGVTIMSTKSSQGERPWPPSTQQMLLDHLRRIVEGIIRFESDFGEEWWFGGGDCLIPWSGAGHRMFHVEGSEDDHAVNKRNADAAKIRQQNDRSLR